MISTQASGAGSWAVGLVAVYLALNLVVVTVALEHLVANPQLVVDWRHLLTTSYSSPVAVLAVACRDRERLQVAYRDHHGAVGQRAVEPYRLVSWGRR